MVCWRFLGALESCFLPSREGTRKGNLAGAAQPVFWDSCLDICISRLPGPRGEVKGWQVRGLDQVTGKELEGEELSMAPAVQSRSLLLAL